MSAPTIRDVLRSTAEKLTGAGLEEAENITEIVLRKILNASRSELFLRSGEILPDGMEAVLYHYVDRLLTGEPVQYVVGETEFFGLKILCDERALIPRPETEVLVESVLKYIKDANLPETPEILDIGTGSGCIAIALAKNGECKVTAVDVNGDALELARKNSRLNQVGDRIKFIEANIFSNDITENLIREFDIIVSNPPYITNEEMTSLPGLIANNEPAGALTDSGDGLGFYRRYVEIIPGISRSNARIFLEISENRSEVIYTIMERILDHIEIISDLAGKPRVLKGCFLK